MSMSGTVIWKYHLPVQNKVTLSMPRFAVPRYVGEQDGMLILWAEVQPQAPTVDYGFRIVGTGQPFSAYGRRYIGTAQVKGFVWHVYLTMVKED